MKRFYKLWSLAVLAFAALSCEEEPIVGEALIATPNSITATATGKTERVVVKANCEYAFTIDQAAAEWLTVTQDKDTLSVVIAENEGGERTGRITFNSTKSNKLLETVTVSQTAKVEAPPPGEALKLEFDFNYGEGSEKDGTHVPTGPVTGWPVSNPGEVVNKTYTLDGVEYTFILSEKTRLMRSGDGTTTLVRIDDRSTDDNNNQVASNHYLGLPAIEGKKLVKVEILNFASGTRETVITDKEWNEVSNVQNLGSKETYTFELTNTNVNEVYYISSKRLVDKHNGKFIGFEKVTLYYESDTPTDNPGEKNALALDFAFDVKPLAGWPTEKVPGTTVEGGMNCIYPLNGVDYVFNLADCVGAKNGNLFWDATVPCFKIGAERRFLGLPAIEGKKLIKVEVHTIASGSSEGYGITADTVKPTDVDKNGYSYVEGGEKQIPAAKDQTPKVLTYNLKGTEAGKVYRFFSYQGTCSFTKLTLTYAE